MKKKTIKIIDKCYKNAIQDALKMVIIKHRFFLNIRKYNDNDWNHFNKIIKKYPPMLIITDNNYITKTNTIELIY